MSLLIQYDPSKIIFANKLFAKVLEAHPTDQLKSAASLLATELFSLFGQDGSVILQSSLVLRAVVAVSHSFMIYY